MKLSARFLMCPPDHYNVDYVINPWMEGNIDKTSRRAAVVQWEQLHRWLASMAIIETVAPQAGLPDMVFTANSGAVLGDKVALSHFLYRQRQPEETHFKRWFEEHKFEVFEMPGDLPFEGAGDALLDRAGDWLWAAYGLRTELDAHPYLASGFDIEVCSLRLVDARFYHLDTCLCPLEGGYLLFYPPAFDHRSNELIETRVPSEKRIAVSEADALRFVCNAINVEDRIFLHQASAELKATLTERGFEVIETPLTEFLKSGGSAKCLTLQLTEPRPAQARAATTVQSRRLQLEGHLLESGLLDRALDFIVDSGGSFQILRFHPGHQRQSISKAEVQVSAPSADVLEKIIGQMIPLGAVVPENEEADAVLEPVRQPGVAPDNFYATTIFPTEVRVAGQWLRVQGQRMDAVIVVSEPEQRSNGVRPSLGAARPALLGAIEGSNIAGGLNASAPEDGPEDGRTPPSSFEKGDNPNHSVAARCRLFRHLQTGDRVVVRNQGIRTLRRIEAREAHASFSSEAEFAFMGAGVSSERRVELAVERIAWEMRRIRNQRGKTVVVAGPVVIHTGGAKYLAELIRDGYVQAVLGGNGVAVHDIEQALLGTSLGLDLKRGASVPGGHRHHLRAINIIRGCGSIEQAVKQGVLTRGIFYECVRRQVPFALAASIRDDGPLPDTETDLIKAQDNYARLLEGAEMILMLSSMLHSIGVGNMTPAGVKLICVDINPAVVTKLSDRGSIESVGVVTDVGLFLNLLTQRLRKLEADHIEPVRAAA